MKTKHHCHITFCIHQSTFVELVHVLAYIPNIIYIIFSDKLSKNPKGFQITIRDEKQADLQTGDGLFSIYLYVFLLMKCTVSDAENWETKKTSALRRNYY